MSWLRPSTTTERGNSLAEILVATSIFMGISLLLAQLLVFNQKASHKISEQSDVTANLMLVFEKVRNELKRSRVIGVDPDNGALQYWVVARDNNGLPVVDSEGLPTWQGPADAPAVTSLYLDTNTGMLWKEFQGNSHPLMSLGPGAELEFVWTPSNQTVVLSGSLGRRNDSDATLDNRMNFAYQICMTNNE